MIFPFVKVIAAAAVASAVPFKRYDNNTEAYSPQSADYDTTVTIDKFITITLPSTTLTVPATASDDVAKAISLAEAIGLIEPITTTSTIVEYTTIEDHGSAVESPIATKTSTITSTPTTTSTITQFVTITEPESSSALEACAASTVTVTVTEKESSKSEAAVVTGTTTHVSAYPVEAEFTLSGTTTTITSFVDVTTTDIFTTSAALNSTNSLQGSNGTYQVPSNLKRAVLYAF